MKVILSIGKKGNPVLDIWQHLLEPAMDKIIIERPEKFGGNLEFNSYTDLEESYLSGSLHPLDLKNGAASALSKIVKPMQDECEANSEYYEKLVSAMN